MEVIRKGPGTGDGTWTGQSRTVRDRGVGSAPRKYVLRIYSRASSGSWGELGTDSDAADSSSQLQLQLDSHTVQVLRSRQSTAHSKVTRIQASVVGKCLNLSLKDGCVCKLFKQMTHLNVHKKLLAKNTH